MENYIKILLHFLNKMRARKIAECFTNEGDDWEYCFTEITVPEK